MVVCICFHPASPDSNPGSEHGAAAAEAAAGGSGGARAGAAVRQLQALVNASRGAHVMLAAEAFTPSPPPARQVLWRGSSMCRLFYFIFGRQLPSSELLCVPADELSSARVFLFVVAGRRRGPFCGLFSRLWTRQAGWVCGAGRLGCGYAGRAGLGMSTRGGWV